MLGMFLGAVNQTIIAPAMPRIVAELGGMQHYSSIVVSALRMVRGELTAL
jgi:hypothetical protein